MEKESEHLQLEKEEGEERMEKRDVLKKLLNVFFEALYTSSDVDGKSFYKFSEEIQNLSAVKLCQYFKDQLDNNGKLKKLSSERALLYIEKRDYEKINIATLFSQAVANEIINNLKNKSKENIVQATLNIVNSIQNVHENLFAYSAGLTLGDIYKRMLEQYSDSLSSEDFKAVENCLLGKTYETKRIAGIIALDYIMPIIRREVNEEKREK